MLFFAQCKFRPGIQLFKSRFIWIPGLIQTWYWGVEFQVYFNKSIVWLWCCLFTTRSTSRNPLEILPVCSIAVLINRELHLFLIHERPSLQWLSRKHLPSFALQGLVFEQIFLSTRPEKKFQYLITTSNILIGVIFFGEI